MCISQPKSWLKNKSEIVQLHQETQKLYEKLTVLRFVEENFADVKPTIGQSEIEEKIEAAFQTVLENDEPEAEIKIDAPVEAENEETNEPVTLEEIAEVESEDETEETEEAESEEQEEIVASETAEEETPEPEIEEEPVAEEAEEVIPAAEDNAFKPAFELSFDTKSEEPAKEEIKNESPQMAFDDLLGPNYVDPVFVKPEDLAREKEVIEPSNVIPIGRSYNDNAQVIPINKDSMSLNDRLSKGIIIGLNDRIAFMNHLFANSSEDYNRVLSQLITFDTFEEAQNFIDNFVKPDYNNWEGKTSADLVVKELSYMKI